MAPDEPATEPAETPAGDAASTIAELRDQASALRYRVDSLERRATSDLTAPRWGLPVTGVGAGLVLAGLALPWLVPDDAEPGDQFSDRWVSGWSVVLQAIGGLDGDHRVALVLLTVVSIPAAAALGFATAIGTSRRLAAITGAVATLAALVCFVLMLLVVGGATRPDSDVGGGLLTALVGSGLLGAAALRRRRELTDPL